MKKLLLVLMSSMLIFAVAGPTVVDAKPSKSYKSPAGGFKQPTTPAKPDSGVSKSQTGTNSSAPNVAKPGFFSGGGFMKGMLIGGLAGMLFGGLFGNMGMMGNILGLLVNVFAIIALIMIVRAVFVYFKNRRKPDTDSRRY